MRIASLEACDPQQLFSQEIQQIVERTLAGLPTQTRRIFNMSRLDNLPQKEIARLCGMTMKGVEFHIGRAAGNFEGLLSLFCFFISEFLKKKRFFSRDSSFLGAI